MKMNTDSVNTDPPVEADPLECPVCDTVCKDEEDLKAHKKTHGM